MTSPERIAQSLRQLPDLDDLERYLERAPETITRSTFADQEQIPKAPTVLGFDEGLETTLSIQQQASQLVESCKQAVHKIRHDGVNADLDPHEAAGLEAIVSLIGRPAILIQNGQFFPPPPGWERLEDFREGIERTFRSVGRIEVSGHPAYDWVGTGFLVTDDVVMTNRHVAKEFCRRQSTGEWVFEPGMEARIDFVEDLNAFRPAEFVFTEVIGVHDTVDMALLRVEPRAVQGVSLPDPLPISSQPPVMGPDRYAYIVGYPAWDGRRNDPEEVRRIFTGIYGIKRLQPGKILDIFEDRNELTHDCSTLGGNSGSCLVDLDTNLVIGLHYSGRYLQANHAVTLWTMRDDPLLQKAGVPFG
jgi:hypothetical protein